LWRETAIAGNLPQRACAACKCIVWNVLMTVSVRSRMMRQKRKRESFAQNKRTGVFSGMPVSENLQNLPVYSDAYRVFRHKTKLWIMKTRKNGLGDSRKNGLKTLYSNN
jgi:hypothetical protein